MAAHGSNANSSLPGVMLGVGGLSLESDRTDELLEVDRCLLNCPVDMSRQSVEVDACQLIESRESTVDSAHAEGDMLSIKAATRQSRGWRRELARN